jgi:hypothetical protein
MFLASEEERHAVMAETRFAATRRQGGHADDVRSGPLEHFGGDDRGRPRSWPGEGATEVGRFMFPRRLIVRARAYRRYWDADRALGPGRRLGAYWRACPRAS